MTRLGSMQHNSNLKNAMSGIRHRRSTAPCKEHVLQAPDHSMSARRWLWAFDMFEYYVWAHSRARSRGSIVQHGLRQQRRSSPTQTNVRLRTYVGERIRSGGESAAQAGAIVPSLQASRLRTRIAECLLGAIPLDPFGKGFRCDVRKMVRPSAPPQSLPLYRPVY